MKQINSLDELRIERARVNAQIEGKKNEIALLQRRAVEFYSPSNLVRMLTSKFSTALTVADVLIQFVDRGVDAFEKHKSARRAAKAEKAAAKAAEVAAAKAAEAAPKAVEAATADSAANAD